VVMLPAEGTEGTAADDAPEPESGEGPRAELLLFALGEEWYGLSVEQVAGVEPRRPVARLPGVPPSVLGLLLWHGEVIPALDPAPLLTGRVGPPEDGYLVVGRAATGPVALLVREVVAVVTIDPGAIEAPLPTVEPQRARLVSGQVQVEGRWVAVLALDTLVDALVREEHGRA
jgi:purine-binding chemotaxis protein CheW